MSTRSVEMVYENGMLRPLKPLELQEGQHIMVTLPAGRMDPEHDEFLQSLYREADKLDRIPTLEEVQQMLSGIKGSLAETVIAERGEY